MITVEQLADMVEDEIMDAVKYLKCAIACKDSRPDMAAMFFDLSQQEMQHMNRLHDKMSAMYQGE